MLIPGIFIGVCGETVGDGEGAGIFMPGMFVIAGVGDGDAFGVGDGIAIVWLGCCARSEPVLVRTRTSIIPR
jgi:hypothetical protein